MIFSLPLVAGVLVRRYKRFLADVILDCGKEITASVPNTGSMLGLASPGVKVWLSQSDKTTRKYRFRLEIVEINDVFVGVNAGLSNSLAEEALRKNLLPSLLGYTTILREQQYHKNSRIDLLLHKDGFCDAFVEVKNVHCMRFPGLAEFPDTVTIRGAKQLTALIDVVKSGHRGIILFIIQRSDCNRFAICHDLDPFYGKQFTLALQYGVEAYALCCDVTTQGISAIAPAPVSITDKE